MRLLFVVVAAVLVACSPRTREECMLEAAKMPTERGVSLAAAQCNQKFPQP